MRCGSACVVQFGSVPARTNCAVTNMSRNSSGRFVRSLLNSYYFLPIKRLYSSFLIQPQNKPFGS